MRQLRVFLHLAWVLPALAFAIGTAVLHRVAYAGAQEAIDHASRVAQEQALKLFETNAMLLQRMLDLLGDASDEEVLANGAQLHDRLRRMAAGLPQVQGLFVNGADAKALANSLVFPPPREIDYSDREYFSVHRDGRVGVFFTEQLRSRISGEPFFDMNQRRAYADGSFAGTVHVSLRPSYLTDFYAELAKSEPGLRFALFRSDGKLLARWPGTVTDGLRISESTVSALEAHGAELLQRGSSALDGTDQLRAFRRLAPYPLWVAASIDTSAVRAGWLANVAWLALLAVVVALTLVWVVRLAMLRTAREFDAAQQLDDETALRQRTEMALLQSQKLEALGRLTGGVAHDFNNLLMVINNNLFVYRSAHPELRNSAQLSAIERAISTGTKLTRQLLSFSRRQALVPERVDLKRRLPALIDLLTPVLGSRIVLNARAEDGAVINVDPAELELALINLAVNAKDSMPEGGQLTLLARLAANDEAGVPDQQGRFVVIEVADTGSGIAPEHLGRVFEPFFTTKTVAQGTGLGLSQVQALCTSAGGEARIESELGRGTRLLLYFPVAPLPEEAGDAAPSSGGLHVLDCRVLLVEDNDAVARTSSEVLRSMGCCVEHAVSADAALARLAADGPQIDVVVSDIEMSGTLDGVALAERIATTHPHIPVVLMTGYAARLEQAERLRFNVLPKPVAPAVLIDAIAKATAGAVRAEPRPV
jgi:signal transduction histidine kinase/ActR/RegA family two-component response regulator